MDKLIDFSGGKDEELRDISGLGEYLEYLINHNDAFNRAY